MGIAIRPEHGTGRAKCRGCGNKIPKGELCVYATSTNVPTAAVCAGYKCWVCFVTELPDWKKCKQIYLSIKRRRNNDKRLEKEIEVKAKAAGLVKDNEVV